MKYESVPDDRHMFSSGELADSVSFSEPTSEISDHGGTGEWYCRNQDCIVREVQVHFKLLFDEPIPTSMKCPTCGDPMAFHHWIKHKLLLAVREPTP